jgi:hypothetical protein
MEKILRQTCASFKTERWWVTREKTIKLCIKLTDWDSDSVVMWCHFTVLSDIEHVQVSLHSFSKGNVPQHHLVAKYALFRRGIVTD